MPKPGYLTPSSFDGLMSNGRKSDTPGQTAWGVINRLVLDWMGVRPAGFSTPATERGTALEHEARELYIARAQVEVIKDEEFRVCPTHAYVGGTCDGLILGSGKGIEIKCPENPCFHLDFVDNQKKYYYQMQGYMWIYQLDEMDYVSYHPEFSVEHQLKILTVKKDTSGFEKLVRRCEEAYELAVRKYYSITGEVSDDAGFI